MSDEETFASRVSRAVDPDELLPGEKSDSPYVDDAEHWLNVYTDMRQFKELVLEMTYRKLNEADPAFSEELRSVDAPLLRGELERAVRRQRFWDARLQELRGRSDNPADRA